MCVVSWLTGLTETLILVPPGGGGLSSPSQPVTGGFLCVHPIDAQRCAGGVGTSGISHSGIRSSTLEGVMVMFGTFKLFFFRRHEKNDLRVFLLVMVLAVLLVIVPVDDATNVDDVDVVVGGLTLLVSTKCFSAPPLIVRSL